MQTDPIGYGDGLNWYAYVGGDPVNRVDPTGLALDIAGEVEPFCQTSCGLTTLPGSRSYGYTVDFYPSGDGSNFSARSGPQVSARSAPRVIVEGGSTIYDGIGSDDPNEISINPDAIRGSESGPVGFVAVGGEGYVGLGGGVFGGGYHDFGTGQSGYFGTGESTAVAWNSGIGYGGSAGVQGGYGDTCNNPQLDTSLNL